MHKKSFAAGAMLLSLLTAGAAPLTPQEALQRLDAALSGRTAPRLVETINGDDGQVAVYVFTYSGSEGFMLVAADDAVAPLLGYSPEGTFAMNPQMTNLNAWLRDAASQISACRALPPYIAAGTRAESKTAIAPLITSAWDQAYPYNAFCPTIDGNRCVTGCVATAMAQVMNYWEYPEKGQGSITFSPYGFSSPLSLDFSTVTFDWENMRDRYSPYYSSTEAHAVATLMKACGYSVKMSYSPTGSGASSSVIASALITYFNYDRGAKEVYRIHYSNDEWDSLIYDQLATVGPVIYGGSAAEGAHCFICDGYDGNGLFHINWGWSGVSDGYFLLNALDPTEQGMGGYAGGYNNYQSAIINVMPLLGRLSAVQDPVVDNATPDSGNVRGQGYIYRVDSFRNILLSVTLRASGGYVNSPLYVSVYEKDPETKQIGEMVHSATFGENVHIADGTTQTVSTRLSLQKYDPTKFYYTVIAYDLNGTRTPLGNLTLGASSGVESLEADSSAFRLVYSGDVLSVEGGAEAVLCLVDLTGTSVAMAEGENPAVSLTGLASGVYVGVAQDSRGGRVVKRIFVK